MNWLTCHFCNYKTQNKQHYEKHCNSKKHKLSIDMQKQQEIQNEDVSKNLLNKIPDVKKYGCELCLENFQEKDDYNEHMKKKHFWIETYLCNPCGYVSCNKYHYKKHCETKKHMNNQINENENKNENKNKYNCNLFDNKKMNTIMNQGSYSFECELCKRKYKSYSGYLRHHKKFHFNNNKDNLETNMVMYENKKEFQDNNTLNKGLVISNTNTNSNSNSNIAQLTNLVKTLIHENKEIHDTLMKENKELKKTMINIAKEPKIVNNNNCKTFNIIQFLNKDCKDAMNLTEFIQNLVVTFDDLQKIEEYGYMIGVKNSLIQTLQTMDKTKRPIHCTDTKRKQFYIKDDNSWNKDTNNQKLDTVLKQYNHNQLRTLSEWKTQNPNWIEQEHLQTHVNKLNKELTMLYSEAGTKIKNKIVSEICEATVLKDKDKDKDKITNSISNDHDHNNDNDQNK